jgi:hypothetical protein
LGHGAGSSSLRGPTLFGCRDHATPPGEHRQVGDGPSNWYLAGFIRTGCQRDVPTCHRADCLEATVQPRGIRRPSMVQLGGRPPRRRAVGGRTPRALNARCRARSNAKKRCESSSCTLAFWNCQMSKCRQRTRVAVGKSANLPFSPIRFQTAWVQLDAGVARRGVRPGSRAHIRVSWHLSGWFIALVGRW